MRNLKKHATKIEEQIDPVADSSRLVRLREALRTNHLHEEEKTSLLTICDEYPELFTLEGDVTFIEM